MKEGFIKPCIDGKYGQVQRGCDYGEHYPPWKGCFGITSQPGLGLSHLYRETGKFGDLTGSSATITTTAALIIGDVLEIIILGDSGV